MTEGVKRLCSVTPAALPTERNDGAPIVLWSGHTPAAILQYRDHSDLYGTRKLEQSLVPVDGAEKRGPFPLSFHGTAQEHDAPPQMLQPGRAATADLDGDGTQALILFRASGEAEVQGLQGQYAHERARGGHPLWPHRIRFGAREVLLVPMVPPYAESKGRTPPAVLRFDQSGIRRIELAGLPDKAEVLEVGSVVREGATDLEEIIATFAHEGQAYLSRHRPDGLPIGEPRKLYVEFPHYFPGGELISLPKSQRNVLLDEGNRAAFFIAADKPANWVRRVDLSKLSEDAISLVGAVDEPDGAKVIVRVKNAFYAIDEDGRWLTWSGSAWSPHDKPIPYLRLSDPRDGERIAYAVPSPAQADEILVVYTKPARLMPLTASEIEDAAQRFLRPYQLESASRERVPKLTGLDSERDAQMALERKRRGVGAPINNIEDWKRLLPDSYAYAVGVAEKRVLDDLESALSGPPVPLPEGDPRRADPRYQAWLAWLRSAEAPGETTLLLTRRGGIVARKTVSGHATYIMESALPFERIDFRSNGSAFTAVMTLESACGAGSQTDPGLYLIHFTGGP